MEADAVKLLSDLRTLKTILLRIPAYQITSRVASARVGWVTRRIYAT